MEKIIKVMFSRDEEFDDSDIRDGYVATLRGNSWRYSDRVEYLGHDNHEDLDSFRVLRFDTSEEILLQVGAELMDVEGKVYMDSKCETFTNPFIMTRFVSNLLGGIPR